MRQKRNQKSDLLLFCMLLFLSLHVLLFWHTDQHHQDQLCLWMMLAGSAHVRNSPVQELALEHLFRVGAERNRGET